MAKKVKEKVVGFKIKDKGTGKVLYSWETTFKDNGYGFDSPLFACGLLEHYEEQLRNLTEMEINFLEDKKDSGKGV
jgi:hypothetical protein